MLKQISLLTLVFISIACKKPQKKSCEKYQDQVCDNSQFTLMNRTQDSIFYGIGSNMWEDTLLPGAQRILQYGKVKVTYDADCNENKETYSTHQLNSNWGSWAYNLDHCNGKSAFEYDDETKSGVSLYDVTEN